MAHFFFDVDLELSYPKASPPRAAGDPHLYVYTCDLHLVGCKMAVMVPVPANADGSTPMYAHGTRAQVLGAGDVVGHTIFLRQPTVVPSDQPSRRRPFVLFKATITAWTWEVFTGTVAGGALCPAGVNVGCLYDLQNEHLRGLDHLEDGTVVTVSGHLLGFADNCLDFKVHDLSLNPDIPPCNAGSFELPSVHSPGAQQALCQWFATYYPYAKPEDPAVDDASTATNSPALERAGTLSANAHTPARCTSEDAESIRRALETAFASRDEGPIGQTPVDPRVHYDTPSDAESELHWLRPGESPAYADASAHETPSGSMLPPIPTSPFRGTPFAQGSVRMRACASRHEVPTGQTPARRPVRYDTTDTPSEAESELRWLRDLPAHGLPAASPAYADASAHETPSGSMAPSVAAPDARSPFRDTQFGQGSVPYAGAAFANAPAVALADARSAIRNRIASKYGVPPGARPTEHQVIDLTQDSSEDEAIFERPVGGVKRCKWLANSSGTGRVVSCAF